MNRVLFVSNGHGEAAIAQRLALEVRRTVPEAEFDHVALVGSPRSEIMDDVGPRRSMPSGGLIAMGNARNLARDLRAGLVRLTWAQARFLRNVRGRYAAAVCVGDVYALAMTLLARAPTIFVGSAKSVEVAPYGPVEERVLARAQACFGRDERTATALRSHRINAEAANAIVDLFAPTHDPRVEAAVTGFSPALALFPGSRESAYDDAEFLLRVTGELAEQRKGLGAVFSIAGGLDADRFARRAADAGWEVRLSHDECVPFALRRGGRDVVRAWTGPLGPLLGRVVLVLGQAGTANEGAAAAGVPVVAFERDGDRRARWYRQRQRGLLGEALAVVPGRLDAAVQAVNAILDDAPRRRRMGETGRTRMGPQGGARRIALRVASLMEQSRCGV